MNRPPQTPIGGGAMCAMGDHAPLKRPTQAETDYRTEQKAKMQLLWQALREACQAKHLDGSPGTPRGRCCACGKGMGHGQACEMLAIIRNFFLTADLDKPKSWEYALVDMLSGVIP